MYFGTKSYLKSYHTAYFKCYTRFIVCNNNLKLKGNGGFWRSPIDRSHQIFLNSVHTSNIIPHIRITAS